MGKIPEQFTVLGECKPMEYTNSREINGVWVQLSGKLNHLKHRRLKPAFLAVFRLLDLSAEKLKQFYST